LVLVVKKLIKIVFRGYKIVPYRYILIKITKKQGGKENDCD